MLSDKLEPFINLSISGILITPQVFCPWQYFQVHLMFVSFHFLISESDFIFFNCYSVLTGLKKVV